LQDGCDTKAPQSDCTACLETVLRGRVALAAKSTSIDPKPPVTVLLIRIGLAGSPAKQVGTSQPGIVFPRGAVVVVDTSAPSRVTHVWPVVLIEAWGVLQAVLVGIKDEALVHRIQA